MAVNILQRQILGQVFFQDIRIILFILAKSIVKFRTIIEQFEMR